MFALSKPDMNAQIKRALSIYPNIAMSLGILNMYNFEVNQGGLNFDNFKQPLNGLSFI